MLTVDFDSLMLETGVIQFFKKLDVGTFDIGDYLGNTYIYDIGFVNITLFLLGFSLFSFTIFSNRCYICCNRFCLHIAGIIDIKIALLLQNSNEYQTRNLF